MNPQNATYAGTIRYRAEDDLLHFDRSKVPKATECETDLSKPTASAQSCVRNLRPRWLISRSQPLVRPHFDV